MAGEIFISYRRADQVWARLLHAQLQAEGVEAWYDAHVGAGQDWRIATANALEASQIFVLLFSASAAQSADIAKELAAASLEKKLIIPVRLEDISPKGTFLYELASRNWINAFEDTETKLAGLAKALAHMVHTGVRDESVLPFHPIEKAEQSPARPRKLLRKPVLIAAAAIAMAAAGAALFWLYPKPVAQPVQRWTVESSRPFISTLALEGEPAFSPDGKMLAYTSGKDALSRKIYMRNVAGGDGIKVTSDAYDDVSPSWSPDGTRIAYIAQKLGEPCHIMVATVPAGEAREAGRCLRAVSSAVAWQANSSSVYYLDEIGTKNTIMRLDLDSGAQRQIDSNPFLPLQTYNIRCSPDGKFLVHLRVASAGNVEVVTLELSSGKEQVLGKFGGTVSTAWAQDSRAVLVSTSNGLGSEITAYPADGSSAYRIYTTVLNVAHLAASSGGLLAIETDTSRSNLARAGALPSTQPDLIDPANGSTWSPTFAPDGTLSFLSNRSGANAVWIIKPGASPTQLFDGGTSQLNRESFSPDGSRLALVISLPKNFAIKILTASGASIASFGSSSAGYGLPTWTPDGKELILYDRAARRPFRIAVATPAQRRTAAAPPWDSIAIRDNGVFAFSVERTGLWRIDHGEKLVSAKYPSRWFPPIAFRGNDVLIPDFGAADGPRILAQPATGGPDRVVAYAPGAQTGTNSQSTIAVNPKTGAIIYVAAVLRDTNIDLLTLAKH